MTYSITEEDRESGGSYETVFATLNITSLANANNEPFDPASVFGFAGVRSVSVVGIEEPESYVVQFDHLENALYVEGYGGTDPTAGTDVGEVRLKIDGDLGP